MAELTYSAEQIQRLLRCPVCLDRYREPRLLPCQHTFCLRPCLEGVVDISTRSLRCPECRAEHRLPNRGLSALPKNLTIISFLELPSPSPRSDGATPLDEDHSDLIPRDAGGSLVTPRGVGGMPQSNVPFEIHCSSCSRSGTLSRCPHCEDEICEECLSSHTAQVRGDVNRLLNQIRRSLPRLSEAVMTNRQHTDQLKQNCEVVSREVQNAIDGLVKELRARQVMLKSELNTFLLGEQHSLRLALETLEVEAATIFSFCDSTESMLQRSPNNVPLSDLIPVQQQCFEHLQSIRTQSNASSRLPSASQPRFVCNSNEAKTVISNFGELVVNSLGRRTLNSQRETPAAFADYSVAFPSIPPVLAASNGPDLSSHRSGISQYLRRLPTENRNETRNQPNLPSTAEHRLLSRRRPRDQRNNSDRIAGLIGAEPVPSVRRRTWNINAPVTPLEMPSRTRSDSPDDAPEATSSIVTAASGQGDQVGETSVAASIEEPSAGRRPVPAPVRFDIDLTENLEELADDLENTITFRYSTGDSAFVSTPRNNYSQKGRSILRFGERGTEQSRFTWPRGVAIHPETNNILVADSSNHRVQVFDDCGRFVKTIGSYGQGEGEIDCLAGVTVNLAGDIIITDRYNQRIQVFNANGQFKSTFGSEGTGDGQLNYPWGVATDGQGNIYVCDKENHRVQVFRPDGTFLRKFGAMGSRAGQFENPYYLALSPDNQIYVTDSNNHRIQVFDETGVFLFSFGVQGTQIGQVKFPKGIAVDEQGFVLVADSGNNRVQVFRQDGRFYCTFGSWGSENGQFKGLEGIGIMSNGNVVVSDRENHRIQVF